MTITKIYETMYNKLVQYNQEHLLTFWEELSEKEKEHLIEDINEIDFEKFIKDIKVSQDKAAKQKIEKVDNILEPLSPEICGSSSNSSQNELDNYMKCGLQSVSNGEYCAILMAGGAGTRLGVSYPKGMYNVGLPSQKSLFQIQAERLLCLQRLAKNQFGRCKPILWYIMTSECTKEGTVDFFERNQFFGLLKNQVVFFEQFTLPVMGVDGKILMSAKHRISKSPDGNGGLYRSLFNYKMIDHMRERGIKYTFVYGVDNILVKIADPLFLGYSIAIGAECAAKVVKKTEPDEPVGVVGLVNGRFQVVEYSEINPETAGLIDPNGEPGQLLYRHANICTHLFHIDFLERVCQEEVTDNLPQHIALKKVPSINTKTGMLESPSTINGIKMEKFVFDVFPEAKTFAVWQVERDREFSPLKNAPGSKSGSPETSRQALLDYQKQLLKEANSTDGSLNNFIDFVTLELSPLVTYSGEGLQSVIEKLTEDVLTEGKYDLCIEKDISGNLVILKKL